MFQFLSPRTVFRRMVRCMSTSDRLVLRRPNDLHLHVRDGGMLRAAVPFSAKNYGRCTIMPNTVPPITTVSMAAAYKKRILACVGEESGFDPLMTLYLTDKTTEEDVVEAAASEDVVGFKLYPAGATTNSENGVTDVGRLVPIFEQMASSRILLLVHGEVTDPTVDVFDREQEFIHRILEPLLDKVQDLRVVMEHITTQQAVEFVRKAPSNVAASITPQHLLLNRNDLFKGGIRPHHYCLPILKREHHRQAVLEAAISGDSKFFLGTDSAPHSMTSKESSCGCAGIFNAPVALPIYTAAFEKEEALDKLEAFMSLNGAQFYGFQPNEDQIELVKEDWIVPESYSYKDFSLVPFMAGEKLSWKVKDSTSC